MTFKKAEEVTSRRFFFRATNQLGQHKGSAPCRLYENGPAWAALKDMPSGEWWTDKWGNEFKWEPIDAD